MNATTLLLLEGAFLLTCGLLFFNQRFRSNFLMAAWKMKFFVIVPLVLVGLVYGMGGSAGVNTVVPQAVVLIFTLLQALVFSLFQIFIMFWAMGRPQIDWYYPGEGADLTWDDWIGPETTKTEMKKMVASLREWRKFEAAGTKPANGAMFYGPPGTGKSHSAKVIASQAGIPVAIVTSASLNGPFVAMGMLIVNAMGRKFRKVADQYGGMVAFLDEIDAIGMSRGSQGAGGMLGGTGFGLGGGGGMGGNGTLQSLLTQMSGASSGETWLSKRLKRWGLSKGDRKSWRILWIAATNINLSLLDPALTRAGRFGSIKIYIGAPNEDEREQHWKYRLRNKKVAGDIDIKQLVQGSRGMTGADIEELVEAAARTVVFEGEGLEVGFKDLWKQMFIHKFGQPAPVGLHESAKRPIAGHEAGHATAIVDYPPAWQECSGATLRPRADFLAAVFRERTVDEHTNDGREDNLRSILIALAARAVEEVVFKNRYNGVTSDLNQAMRVALNMVCVQGMGKKLKSTLATGGGPSPRDIAEAELIVNAVYRFAKETYIPSRLDAVKAVTDALIDKTDLTGPEVIELVRANGKPELEFIEPVIDQIIAEMEIEEKKERAEMAALSRMHDAPAQAALPAPQAEGTEGVTVLDRRVL